MKIGIVLLATNAYLPLGIRFVKNFLYHYKGKFSINFYFFSNEDPKPYLSKNEYEHINFTHTCHDSWVNGVNSKFYNIMLLDKEKIDYIYYFDADTGIYNNFTEAWFIDDMVAGEHYNNSFEQPKPYDTNPQSSCYVDPNSKLFQCYYYGAFFGGLKNNIIKFCKIMTHWQNANKKIKHEPIWNDESYLNAYFHYNPPTKIIKNTNFEFMISDKMSLSNMRDSSKNIDYLKEKMILNRNKIWKNL